MTVEVSRLGYPILRGQHPTAIPGVDRSVQQRPQAEQQLMLSRRTASADQQP